MSSKVYANGREISAKAGANKVIAAFPDVCLSPPTPPAGPVPIPYPVSSNSGDASDGSSTVTIGGQEAMLKDKSYYKKCTGDEAATKSLGQGAINHALSGKVYFVSWSMDVLIEGENVVRHLDMTTSNHASPMANQAVPIPGLEDMDASVQAACAATYEKYKLRRHGKSESCGEGIQSHHVMMNACFDLPGQRGTSGVPGYNTLDAPAVCLKTSGTDSPHKRINKAQGEWKRGLTKPPKLSEVRQAGKDHLVKGGVSDDPPDPSEAECLMKAGDAYMTRAGITESSTLLKPH
jgi:Domain of unknown function (DUF4150)